MPKPQGTKCNARTDRASWKAYLQRSPTTLATHQGTLPNQLLKYTYENESGLSVTSGTCIANGGLSVQLRVSGVLA